MFKKKLLYLTSLFIIFTFFYFEIINVKLHSQNNQANLDGLAGAGWGDAFSKVKSYLKDLTKVEATTDKNIEKVEILNMIKNEYILIKRNDISYTYNFYKTPFNVARLSNINLQKNEYEENEEGKLYHVQLRLPLVETELISKRIVQKYGESLSNNINTKGQGFKVWELKGGYIYLWCEAYDGKAFSRRMDYISSQFREKISKEYKDYFDAKEKYMIEKARVN